MPKLHILLVCMGNICRSPTAEGVLRQYLAQQPWGHQIELDSAGTHAYHTGEAPDPRSLAAGQQRGYDFADLRARAVLATDFVQFDYILSMDEANYSHLCQIAPDPCQAKIQRFLDYAHNYPEITQVPDPYYGAGEGFDYVLDLVEDASHGLIQHLAQQLQS